MTSVESEAAVEETIVVDVRVRHVSSGNSAAEIGDIVAYLLADYSFLARANLCRVFKLCCLVVLRPYSEFPAVDIDLSDCKVPQLVVLSGIRWVQSCVSAASYKRSAFFTKHTSRSDSVKSSEVRISIRFGIRSQVVLCYFSRVISHVRRR